MKEPYNQAAFRRIESPIFPFKEEMKDSVE